MGPVGAAEGDLGDRTAEGQSGHVAEPFDVAEDRNMDPQRIICCNSYALPTQRGIRPGSSLWRAGHSAQCYDGSNRASCAMSSSGPIVTVIGVNAPQNFRGGTQILRCSC